MAMLGRCLTRTRGTTIAGGVWTAGQVRVFVIVADLPGGLAVVRTEVVVRLARAGVTIGIHVVGLSQGLLLLVTTVLDRIRLAPSHQIEVVGLRAKTVCFGGALVGDGMRFAGLSVGATFLDLTLLHRQTLLLR